MREADLDAAEKLVRACLRETAPAWPEGADPDFGDMIHECCVRHRVGALVCRSLEAPCDWPPETVARLRELAVAAEMWEEAHRALLSRLLAALAERGIEAVLLKGTALAYGCYPEPASRVRDDTDILIPPHARRLAHTVLAQLGFRPAVQVTGDLINYQASYQARDRLGLPHVIDLHWRISNAQVLSRIFGHAELHARAVPVPALGPAALATGRVDAVLLACLHRQAHCRTPHWVNGHAQFEPDRLIWLYDLHLLASGLTAGEWDELARRAQEKGLAALCEEGLALAAGTLGTRLPAGIGQALRPRGGGELPYRYLRSGPLRQQYLDLRALGGFGPKLRYLRELVFPPAAYMRTRYADVRPAWLPWLYARRALKGSAARLGVSFGRSRAP